MSYINHTPIVGDAQTIGGPQSKVPWHAGPFLAFDTETNGLDIETTRIVQSALIYDEPGQEPFTVERLINPAGQFGIPLECVAVHGISVEHAETHGSDGREVTGEILEHLNHAAETSLPVVVMNPSYDLSILMRECRRYDLPWLKQLPLIICPLTLDRMLDPYRPGRRTLTAIAASYGVAIKGAHQATGDCLASLRLARAIVEKYPRLRALSLKELQVMQAKGYAAWAEGFEQFRRREDPEFTVSREWPIIPFSERGI